MAFNTNPGRQSFNASAGQTDFTFNFKIFEETDIKVYLTPVGQDPDDVTDVLAYGSDYTVTINGDNGGTITLLSGATLNDTLVFERVLPRTRTTSYVTNGDLKAATLNADQDYQTYLLIDDFNTADRSLALPSTDVTMSPELPATRPNSYLKTNEDGTSFEYDTTIPDAVYEAAESAAAALVSEEEAAVSATFSQLKAWEAEAERLTADSYATEAEDVPVKIVTSNGDGTFTYTDTYPVEYSSLHWSNKSAENSGAASTTTYNNSTSGVTATNVQDAVDHSLVKERGTQLVHNPYFVIDRRNAGGTVTFSGVDTDKYIVDRFRVKRTNVSTSLECKRINQYSGGLNLKFSTDGSYREYLYVRQLIWGNVLQYSGKTFTMLVDVDTTETQLEYDVYIQARFNNSDAERVLVEDTTDVTLPDGRNILKVTFTVPTLYDGGGNPLYTLAGKNSLSIAFRTIVPNGIAVTNAEVNINSIHIVSGANQVDIPVSNVSLDDINAQSFYYRSTFIAINGFVSGNRARFQHRPSVKMYASIGGFIEDAVGNVGKVSGYNAVGTRVDNITPLAITYSENTVTVITSHVYTGIGFYHTIDVESNL